MYDAYSSIVSWMIAGRVRMDEPGTRQLEHRMALREAGLSATRPLAPFAWIRERLSAKAPATAACDPLTCSATA